MGASATTVDVVGEGESRGIRRLILGKTKNKEGKRGWRAVEEGALSLETGMTTRGRAQANQS
jgi:hypothetical protein